MSLKLRFRIFTLHGLVERLSILDLRLKAKISTKNKKSKLTKYLNNYKNYIYQLIY